MREEHGGRVEIVECEVAVGDGVDRVAHLVRGRRDRQRRPRERARAERRRRGLRRGEREARTVALEHLDPREQVVAERDRLRALQMRVARHRRRRLRFGARRGSRARTRRSACVGLARTRRRRRAGTRLRPGRCASGRRGSCGRRRRAARSIDECTSSSAGVDLLDRGELLASPRRAPRRRGSPPRAGAARAASVACRSYGRSSASSACRNVPHLRARARRRRVRTNVTATTRACLEHAARVGDVVVFTRELADAVGRGERGRAPLHAQPLRVVA